MKIAVVYNRESQNVINLFGIPNREKLVLKSLQSITRALKKGGHQVALIEGDKDLIDKLEDFMPRVVKGELPGLVFNVSYGIQGQARYTHVPSILEMVGIPYVASGPLAHSLALDKVVTKMILRQHGLPTPDFAVMDNHTSPAPDLEYPLIVKPKNEAVSFGLKVVNDEAELREAAETIRREYQQPVLIERYIKGREINVALMGNNPPEALPPVELDFGDSGPDIYTLEDKTHRSGREVQLVCPAPIDDDLCNHAQEIARKAFTALGCYDCARIDMRLNAENSLYILEVNSLPGMSEKGSYAAAAKQAGMDYAAFVNRLVEVACARYFGTPQPPSVATGSADPAPQAISFITQRRHLLEKRLEEWAGYYSRTSDPAGIQQVARRAGQIFEEVGLKTVHEFTDNPEAWTWETARGFGGGTLFIGHIDVPVEANMPHQVFRRDPEWFYGEGIGTSRAPLVMLEYAFRALKSARHLRSTRAGVMLFTDEGQDALLSAELIRKASARAREVFVLRPGTPGDGVITARHGYRKYRLRAHGEPMRAARPATRNTPPLLWMCQKISELSALSFSREKVFLSALDLKTERHPMLLPHRVAATLLVSYLDAGVADQHEELMRDALGKPGLNWKLTLLADRPPMKDRAVNKRLFKALSNSAEELQFRLKTEWSRWPSVAGLAPSPTACLCGLAPVTRDRGTPGEAVQRISLIQRTLLITDFLMKHAQE